MAPSPPPMQRAGGSAVAAGNRHIHPYELLQEINLHQVTYNQGQPNTYPGGDVGHPSGGGERVPVNSPQGYGQPQPPSAATYASTYPESQNYSGMRMRLSDDIGAAVDGSECHEGSTTQLENKFDLILVDIQVFALAVYLNVYNYKELPQSIVYTGIRKRQIFMGAHAYTFLAIVAKKVANRINS